MYENTNITLDITTNTGEKRTLVFSKDANGYIAITLNGEPIDKIKCDTYSNMLKSLSRVLRIHMLKLKLMN